MAKPTQKSRNAPTTEKSVDRVEELGDAEEIIRRGIKKVIKESSEIDDEVDRQLRKIRTNPIRSRKPFRL